MIHVFLVYVFFLFINSSVNIVMFVFFSVLSFHISLEYFNSHYCVVVVTVTVSENLY